MISVIMPTHECPPLLDITLTSVFSQNYDDWELVVMDASENKYFESKLDELSKTSGLFCTYKDKLEKIKIAKPLKNTGYPGHMKMEGFRSCTQDNGFCVFLDHDDMLMPNLLKNIHDALNLYPNTEMITTDYTSFCYNNGYVYTNEKSFMGGVECGTIEKLFFGNLYYGFLQKPLKIWTNAHPWKSNTKPIIVSKKALRLNKFSFMENTQTMDDCLFGTMSHALNETYIKMVGYVYAVYFNGYRTNSVKGRVVSKETSELSDCCKKYGELLDKVKFKKQKNVYIPKQ